MNSSERIAILGGSRGFGAAVAKEVTGQTQAELLVVARKGVLVADFSDESQWESVFLRIMEWKPTRLWYFAGGGPYGRYSEKEWKDHQWAWRVTFLFPAFLLHRVQRLENSSVAQWISVGSTIAENQPDPQASSYCAGKHALRGLITTIQKEGPRGDLDVRLFSPGYMDTDMLPPSALPRHNGSIVINPQSLAESFLRWALSPREKQKNWRFEESSTTQK